MDKFPEEKEGSSVVSNSSRKVFFVLGVLIILGSIFYFLILNPNSVKPMLKCGDGTFNGYCSLTLPYFCSNGTLVENASLCGCPSSFKLNNGFCSLNPNSVCINSITLANTVFCGCPANVNLSNESRTTLTRKCAFVYNSSSKAMYFNYSFKNSNADNVNGTIAFLFRQSVLDYLLSLPHFKIYSANETPRRDEFKISRIDNSIQSDSLASLVTKIENLYPNSKDMQAKVAISLVQDIPYNESPTTKFFGTTVGVTRYPYQVLGENQGSCEGKSELLAYILQKMGFGVTLFYFPKANHEALGIKCPLQYSYLGTGYCFVESTEPSPISFSQGNYLDVNGGVGRLNETPELILINNNGIGLSGNLPDYSDAEELNNLMDKLASGGSLNFIEEARLKSLDKKYGISF